MLRDRTFGHHPALGQLENRWLIIIHDFLKAGLYDHNAACSHHYTTAADFLNLGLLPRRRA